LRAAVITLDVSKNQANAYRFKTDNDMIVPARQPSWAAIGWMFLLLAAFLATDLFRSEPNSEQVWIVEGVVRSVRWAGVKDPSLLVRLDGDPREYLIDTTVLREKGILPADIEWAGKPVRLGVTGKISGIKEYRTTFSAVIDGKILYELEDVRRFRAGQFRPMLALVSGLASIGIVVIWAHRRRAWVAASEGLGPTQAQ
jgi:hypothetical protein